jgi:putrescine transport system ATP-binding protein
VWLAVRPEKIQISKEPPPGNGRCVVPGVVADLAYYGGRSLYRVRTAAGRLLQVSAQNRVRAAERMLEWDQQVYLAWDRAAGAVLRE